MPIIRTRAGKGARLTNAEIDDMHRRPWRTVSGGYTVELSDNRETLIPSSSVTLAPSAVMRGSSETGDFRVTIKNTSASTRTVLRSGSDTIDGATSYVLMPYESVTFVAVGDGYIVEGADIGRLDTASLVYLTGGGLRVRQRLFWGWTTAHDNVNFDHGIQSGANRIISVQVSRVTVTVGGLVIYDPGFVDDSHFVKYLQWDDSKVYINFGAASGEPVGWRALVTHTTANITPPEL